MNSPNTILVATLGAALLLLGRIPAALAQPFSNTAPINVPTDGGDGRATLYPSPIVVSGAPTSIADLSVTLHNFSHSWVSNVSVLLVSPTGQKILLMSGTNASGDASNNTLTFVPDSSNLLPAGSANVISGVYGCSVYAPTDLPPPAPAGPYGTSLAPLLGTDANGTWRLYAWDNTPAADGGTFAGGWSIAFSSTAPGPIGTGFAYQGVLSDAGGPINGNANVRFSLCNSPTVPADFSALALPITRGFADVQNGLISTILNFGPTINANRAVWLNVEVESPPGSGFVTLWPRQPITPVPHARLAQRAVLADTATTASFATTATSANTASSVPWNGVTGVPANVSGAFSPWVSGAGGRITYSGGNVGIGTAVPGARFDLTTNTVGSGWQMLLTNLGPGVGGLRGGARLSDAGFLELTNNASGVSPNFARLDTNGAWSVASDARLKTDIARAEENLAAAMRLRPVSFRWKADGTQDLGLLAQEVRAVLPGLVTGDEARGPLTVNYSLLSVVAIGAIQEQQTRIEAMQRENADLRARLDRLERLLERGAPSP